MGVFGHEFLETERKILRIEKLVMESRLLSTTTFTFWRAGKLRHC